MFSTVIVVSVLKNFLMIQGNYDYKEPNQWIAPCKMFFRGFQCFILFVLFYCCCWLFYVKFSKKSIVIGWFLVTCPWSNLNVSRPGYNKQLLDEVEHDIMNYQSRGLCYLNQITQTRGFDNSWYHAKTEFNNCFIIHFSHNSSSKTEAKRSAILFLRRTRQGA